MKFFSKKEFFWIIVILLAIVGASYPNLKLSLRRGRDMQRKNDVRRVSDSLVRYASDFGAFPLSAEGKMIACRGPETKKDKKGKITGLIPCQWGKDALADIFDPGSTPYVDTLPSDPLADKGSSYAYFSDGKLFQVYASLEGQDEAEFDQKIVARGLACGGKICNFGLGYGATPLDKSIEEYENELLKKK